MLNNTFKVAIIQNGASKVKAETLTHVYEYLKQAAAQSPKLCLLGETFNSFYNKQYLLENAEDFEDLNNRPTYDFLSNSAKEFQTYLITSIPEKVKNSEIVFNTALVFDNSGQLVGKYRKTHLFDIDIPGKITYKESETFQAGDSYCVVDTPFAKIGLGICYDVRFPLFAQALRNKGANFLVYPGAFNQTTGPLHFELLLRSRAVDQQCFVTGVSTARYVADQNIYQAWGHSTVVDPMGRVLAAAEQDPKILYADIDMSEVETTRNSIPTSKQQREDLYELNIKK